MTSNAAHISGATGRVLVNSTTWTAVKVGSVNLPSRQNLLIQNKSTVRMAFTTDSTKVYKECPEIGVGQMVIFPVSADVTIYMKSRSGAGKHVAVMELA